MAGFDANFYLESKSEQLISRHLHFQTIFRVLGFPDYIARLKGYCPPAGNHQFFTDLMIPTRSRALPVWIGGRSGKLTSLILPLHFWKRLGDCRDADP